MFAAQGCNPKEDKDKEIMKTMKKTMSMTMAMTKAMTMTKTKTKSWTHVWQTGVQLKRKARTPKPASVCAFQETENTLY